MSQPLVSIIVPCYNMSAFLEETLRSVVASDYRPLEVIVVDDGSTDDSAEVAEKLMTSILSTFKGELERVSFSLLRQPNSGVSAARNNGLQQARGTYILPLDADDRIGPTFISHAVAAMENNPGLKVVYCRAEFFGERQGEWFLPDYSPALLARKNMIPATALYRRQDALNFGGYCTDEIFREDWDFWLSMLEHGGEVLRLDEVGFFYRIRTGSRRHLTRQQKHCMIDAVNRRHAEFLYKQLGGPLHYHRSWSRFLNLFRKEKVVTNDDNFQFSFFHSPFEKVLHSGRNIIYEQDGLVIKQFAKPGPLKALIYGLFVKSKARRSYEYAGRLLSLGIATPEPVAYKEVRVCGLLRESYYVSRKSSCPHTLQEPTLPMSATESIGRFIAKMHEVGILHRDLSPGNILFDDNGHVEVIDLNRIAWRRRPLDFRTGCQNFERLNIGREALTAMGKAYAEARGFDSEACVHYILTHRWNKHVLRGITNL
ncbi:MAG: glycosyltransferase [Paludibacteraceae bacterium]|nr:glycosyltransferase [Paludibacteraceae bacterium]